MPASRRPLRPRPAGPDIEGAPSRRVGSVRLAPSAPRTRLRALALGLRRRPELCVLLALAALLNLWALGHNGWANEYYSAAVRSMSSSWHNFLYGSFDPRGLMTVDKPPLALWVQALSARVFGYHPLSILVPQALMGVASVALLYDLTRRCFGRAAGFAAGLALATTPITVAISRHNNPDALLVLCCVAALWFTVRAFADGRTRWLVWAGVMVGLGFETKMAVALMVVPGIAAAWLWVAPRGRLVAVRQLLAGGGAMLLVGGAWPLLVALTPGANRPWVSGTSDNSIFSLIFGYNGLGRLDGQTGGANGMGGGGGAFGGSPGPLRLLNSALGGQDGWLLGFALVAGLAILVASRLRRSDPRTGWLLAVGGAFVTTAVAFSAAKGIFHPYYVSLLAPFAAALVGAGAAALAAGRGWTRFLAPLAVAAGVTCELVVLHGSPGQLGWLTPLLIAVGLLAMIALAAFVSRRVRIVALGAIVAALLVGPAIWAWDTTGHATSGTFPAGGPASASAGGFGGAGGRAGNGPPPGLPSGVRVGANRSFGAPPGVPGAGGTVTGRAQPAGGAGGGAGGAFGSDRSLTSVVAYVQTHGGGTVAVASQSGAASSIISKGTAVAGIGGFSGRESSVSVSWLAAQVGSGRLRWVLSDGTRAGLPGDTRQGSSVAMTAVAKACRAVPSSSYSGASQNASTSAGTLYDCAGRAAAMLRA